MHFYDLWWSCVEGGRGNCSQPVLLSQLSSATEPDYLSAVRKTITFLLSFLKSLKWSLEWAKLTTETLLHYITKTPCNPNEVVPPPDTHQSKEHSEVLFTVMNRDASWSCPSCFKSLHEIHPVMSPRTFYYICVCTHVCLYASVCPAKVWWSLLKITTRWCCMRYACYLIKDVLQPAFSVKWSFLHFPLCNALPSDTEVTSSVAAGKPLAHPGTSRLGSWTCMDLKDQV